MQLKNIKQIIIVTASIIMHLQLAYAVPMVSVSSCHNNHPDAAGHFAADQNMQTRWSSEFSDPQWIRLDFTELKTFDFLTIEWETAFGKQYDIQISQDKKYWKTVYQEKDGDGKRDELYLGKQQARYLKLVGKKRGTPWGYSIWEMEAATVDDERQPLKPQQVTAHYYQGQLIVDWVDNQEQDITGYQVLMADDKAGDFQLINREIIAGSHFITASGLQYKPGWIKVVARDYSGQTSSASEAVMIEPIKEFKSGFNIPDAAWQRLVGDLPEKTFSSSPKRGVAIGGFGAGSMMYNFCGTFGPFQSMDNVMYHGQWLPQAAFHFWESSQDQIQVKTLAKDKTLCSAWKQLALGQATYYALQPKGWIVYHKFHHQVSVQFFSPIIPNNYRESSYPLGSWQFEIKNTKAVNSEASIMLTFPAAFISNRLRADGFDTQVISVGQVKGLKMKAKSGVGEWCLAATCKKNMTFSYVPNWDADSDGQDIWKAFEKQGQLPNQALIKADETKAIAIAVKVGLKPYEKVIIPFTIVWDFPEVQFKSGRSWWKHYTKYVGHKGNRSLRLAKKALASWLKWSRAIDQWMKPILEHQDYPQWLKTAAFNELYYSQFGGIFYEAGLKEDDEAYIGRQKSGHQFFEMECMRYPFANTFDVRHYSSLPFLLFWPDIEKNILLSFSYAILEADPDWHQTPHDCGSPDNDPFFKWDHYGTNRLHWKDLHSKFIQQCWRYWYVYKDRKFLKKVWPACKATYRYMKTTDTDGDKLPNNQGSDNTYDSWGLYGTSLLCGGLWVGALTSMEKMADILHDPIRNEITTWRAVAKANLDHQLWDEKSGYYHIDTLSKHPDAIMADGLNGQRYCEAFGLPSILPDRKIKSHLKQVYQRCVVPLMDFNGDGVGDCGAINGIKSDGSLLGKGQSDEIWTGSTYFLAASMVKAGLLPEALNTAYGVYYLTYETPATAYWFNTPEAWHNGGHQPRPDDPEQYQRPRAVWELLIAIDEPYGIIKK